MSNVFPMPHPPGCTCGCRGSLPPQPCPPGQPGWGNWGFRLRECFKEVEEFKELIRSIIEEHGGPVRTGPIIGDVTGKSAKPGEVGEFVINSVTGTFPAAQQIQSVAAIILQPGDWDIQAKCQFGAATAGAAFQLNGAEFLVSPVPTGLADYMLVTDPAEYSVAAGAVSQVTGVTLISNVSQGVFAQPTLLAFQLNTNFGVGSTGLAGVFTFITLARRMR